MAGKLRAHGRPDAANRPAAPGPAPRFNHTVYAIRNTVLQIAAALAIGGNVVAVVLHRFLSEAPQDHVADPGALTDADTQRQFVADLETEFRAHASIFVKSYAGFVRSWVDQAVAEALAVPAPPADDAAAAAAAAADAAAMPPDYAWLTAGRKRKEYPADAANPLSGHQERYNPLAFRQAVHLFGTCPVANPHVVPHRPPTDAATQRLILSTKRQIMHFASAEKYRETKFVLADFCIVSANRNAKVPVARAGKGDPYRLPVAHYKIRLLADGTQLELFFLRWTPHAFVDTPAETTFFARLTPVQFYTAFDTNNQLMIAACADPYGPITVERVQQ